MYVTRLLIHKHILIYVCVCIVTIFKPCPVRMAELTIKLALMVK